MPYGWTADQIKAAIDEGTKELERRIQAHESPEMIHGARQAMDTLYAIRRKETPDWAAIKKTIRVDEAGNVAIVNLMGEIIETDAISVVEVPGEFRVEVE